MVRTWVGFSAVGRGRSLTSPSLFFLYQDRSPLNPYLLYTLILHSVLYKHISRFCVRVVRDGSLHSHGLEPRTLTGRLPSPDDTQVQQVDRDDYSDSRPTLLSSSTMKFTWKTYIQDKGIFPSSLFLITLSSELNVLVFKVVDQMERRRKKRRTPETVSPVVSFDDLRSTERRESLRCKVFYQSTVTFNYCIQIQRFYYWGPFYLRTN